MKEEKGAGGISKKSRNCPMQSYRKIKILRQEGGFTLVHSLGVTNSDGWNSSFSPCPSHITRETNLHFLAARSLTPTYSLITATTPDTATSFLFTSTSWVVSRKLKTHNVLTAKVLFGAREETWNPSETLKLPWGGGNREAGFADVASTRAIPLAILGKQTRVPAPALLRTSEQLWHQISLWRARVWASGLLCHIHSLQPESRHFPPIGFEKQTPD